MRHANPRLYIGPKTNEVIICLTRGAFIEPTMEVLDVSLVVKRRVCGETPISTWLSYAVDEQHRVHFEVPADFTSMPDVFPKGFYDAQLFIGDCHIENLEIIKAPGYYISGADTIEDKCHGGTNWIEPGCELKDCIKPGSGCPCRCKGNPEMDCNCIYQVKNNCPTCCNEEYVSRVNILDGYLDSQPVGDDDASG